VVKLFFLCRRRRDVSHERYVEMLLGDHVPLALAHHPTLRRYVVNVVDGARGDVPEIDSIGELWFGSLADYRERLYDSERGRDVVERDVARFLGAADAYATVEHVEREPATTPVGQTPGEKLIACLGRRPELRRDAFAAHWRERHAPLALRHHATTRYVRNVVQERLTRTGADYDGIAELTFPPGEIQRGMYLGREGQAEIEADIPRFIGSVDAYVVTEHVARW
jgi:hypothetical protein